MCSQRINRDQVMATTVLKKKVSHFEKGSPEEKYLSVLTKYAFNRVNCEMEAMKKVKQACLEHYGSTCDSCSCQFSISMRLPCRHIFIVRDQQNLNLFGQNLFDKRWGKDYFIQVCSEMQSAESPILNSQDVISVTTSKKTLTKNQRFNQALIFGRSLADFVAEFTGDIYDQFLAEMMELLTKWKIELGYIDQAHSSKIQQTSKERESTSQPSSESQQEPTFDDEAPSSEIYHEPESDGQVLSFEGQQEPTFDDEAPSFEIYHEPESDGQVLSFEGQQEPTFGDEAPFFEGQHEPAYDDEAPSSEIHHELESDGQTPSSVIQEEPTSGVGLQIVTALRRFRYVAIQSYIHFKKFSSYRVTKK
ncbi:uncharacterized protein LOC127279029 [Leptopilina boulardi]|uniref:uncharacterized protein LOC127279029 n=1 Tax=Leptopilina boulardi TaxID=63433 RepID=UPI0021F5DB73|nr:uncharacterized protein LOC127279029 [Leptopilina boulardi]